MTHYQSPSRKISNIFPSFYLFTFILLLTLIPTLQSQSLAATIRSSSCPIVLPIETRQLHPSTHIKGGDAAQALTYMVYLLGSSGTANTCTGTLISHTWILTAAHCKITNTHIARIGGLTKRTGIRHEIIRVIPHPDFNGIHSESDLALVELQQSVSSKLIPATVAGSAQVPLSESIARVQGYGRKSTLGQVEHDTELQFVDVPVLKTSICAEAYPDRNVSSKTVCAAYINSNTCTPCKGDSGGPLLQYDRDGRPVVVGVVSAAAPGCGVVMRPIVYVRVGAFIEWIRNTVEQVEVVERERVRQVQLSGGVVSWIGEEEREEQDGIERRTFWIVIGVVIPVCLMIGCLVGWGWRRWVLKRRKREMLNVVGREKEVGINSGVV